MNSSRFNGRLAAFTIIELLCVVAVIAILASLLLPALSRGKAGAQRVRCVQNLKQVGIAFHGFSHDHKSRFPMSVPATEGGTLEFVQSGYQIGGPFFFSFRHFAALSNELVTPSVLVCPSELARAQAPGFSAFRNEHLSYFVGLNAEFSRPGSILAGDRNVTNDAVAGVTVMRLPKGSRLRWTEELHRFKGNILFADGHVEESRGLLLAAASDVVLPTVPAQAVGRIGVPATDQPQTTISAPAVGAGEIPGVNGTEHATPPSGGGDGRHATGNTAGSSSEPGNLESPGLDAVHSNAFVSITNGNIAISRTAASDDPPRSFFARWLLYLLLLLLLAMLAAGLRRYFGERNRA